jgi:hypothetical protein
MTEPLGKAIFDERSCRFVHELGQSWKKWRKGLTAHSRF